MIQARNITFNIEYGRYIKPIEDCIGKRVQIGKGTNNEIASKIYKLSKIYKYYTECDHTTFDAHVTTEMLRLTHTFYQACYKHDKCLRQLSNKTINNNCKTRDNIKYRVRGTRMSGDVDTSLGNSLINYAILKEVVSRLVGKCEVIVNGDDSIIFTKKPIDTRLLSEELKIFNMESKVQESSANIHTVEFCRQKLVINSVGVPTLMINPKRLIDIYGMTYKQQSDYLEYLRQVCVCNIAINVTNPLAQYWSVIYKEAFDEPLVLAEVLTFTHIELRTKLTAIKELTKTPRTEYDIGEFNQTTYRAWGNLDYLDVGKIKIIKKIKKIKNLVIDVRVRNKKNIKKKEKILKINTEMLKYVPVDFVLYIDHNRREIRT
jgi:hypothetical protein